MDLNAQWRVLGKEDGQSVYGFKSEREAEVLLGAVQRLVEVPGHVAALAGGWVVVVEWRPDVDDAEAWGHLVGLLEIVERYGADKSESFFNAEVEEAAA